MFFKPNVKKLLEAGDVAGLNAAIVWAVSSNRPKLERKASEAALSLVPGLQAKGDVEGLKLAAGSESSEVQRAATEALASLGRPDAWDALVHWVPDVLVGESAKAALRTALSDPRAVAHLQRIALGEVQSLSEQPGPSRQPVATAGSANEQRPRLVADLLLDSGAELDPVLLQELTRTGDDEARKRAADLLATADDSKALGTLLEGVIEREEDQMLAPAAAAAKAGGESAIASLDPQLRERAHEYLAEFLRTKTYPLEPAADLLRLLDPAAVEVLTQAVRDDSPDIRYRLNLAGALLSDEEYERIREEDEAKEKVAREQELREMPDTFKLLLELTEAGLNRNDDRIQRALRQLDKRASLGDESARDTLLAASPQYLQLFAWSNVWRLLFEQVESIEQRWSHGMGHCCICGVGNRSGAKSIPAAEFRGLAGQGYDPVLTGRANQAWQRTLTYPSIIGTDWTLCSACATDAATFAALMDKRKQARTERAIPQVAGTALPSAEPVTQATVVHSAPVLVEHGLVALASDGVGFELTPDGLLYADAMLGERDCPDHPDRMADLQAVSGERVMAFSSDQLVTLAVVALGGDFASHVIERGESLDLQQSINSVLLRFAGSLAHATRHSRSGRWTPATPLAELDLDADARSAFERQLQAGQPAEGIARLTQKVLDSWSRLGS